MATNKTTATPSNKTTATKVNEMATPNAPATPVPFKFRTSSENVAGSRYWEPDNVGESLMGAFGGIETRGEDEVAFIGPTLVRGDNALKLLRGAMTHPSIPLKVGETVQLTYTGKGEGKRGRSAARRFKLDW